MPISVTVRAGDSAQDFALDDVATIGRSLENDIVLDSPNAKLLRSFHQVAVFLTCIYDVGGYHWRIIFFLSNGMTQNAGIHRKGQKP